MAKIDKERAAREIAEIILAAGDISECSFNVTTFLNGDTTIRYDISGEVTYGREEDVQPNADWLG